MRYTSRTHHNPIDYRDTKQGFQRKENLLLYLVRAEQIHVPKIYTLHAPGPASGRGKSESLWNRSNMVTATPCRELSENFLAPSPGPISGLGQIRDIGGVFPRDNLTQGVIKNPVLQFTTYEITRLLCVAPDGRLGLVCKLIVSKSRYRHTIICTFRGRRTNPPLNYMH